MKPDEKSNELELSTTTEVDDDDFATVHVRWVTGPTSYVPLHYLRIESLLAPALVAHIEGGDRPSSAREELLERAETRKVAELKAENEKLREAGNLLYQAWEQLLPNLKRGVVQDYQLVCTTAPLAWKALSPPPPDKKESK